jgi:hypothetical protein
MMQWMANSNVADVLSLGPRTAGRLALVGVRTAGQLLDADAAGLALRLAVPQLSSEQLACWQREARLLLAIPGLSCETAQLFVAIDWLRPERIARGTPTELLASVEEKKQEKNCPNWLKNSAMPSVLEASDWIFLVQESSGSSSSWAA